MNAQSFSKTCKLNITVNPFFIFMIKKKEISTSNERVSNILILTI